MNRIKWFLFLVVLLQVFEVIVWTLYIHGLPVTTKFQVFVCLKLEGAELNMAFVMMPLCIILFSFLYDATCALCLT